MKALLIDIETSKLIYKGFSLYPEAISHNDIIQDWYIICACWKWLGEDKVYNERATKPGDDKKLLQSLSAAIKNADYIIFHNGKKFDSKKIVARLVYHRLDPIPYLPAVDTLIEIKKVAAHTSHRLDYLGKFLLGEGKIDNEPGLWDKAMDGNKTAINKMVTYCAQDVKLLEKVYKVYRPYFKTHPHTAIMKDGAKCDCPKCSSVKTQKRGIEVTVSGNKKQRLQCQDCGSWFTVALKDIK